MKLTFAIPVLAVVLTTGCTSLVSVHPFLTGQDAVFDPALAGVWAHNDDTFVIRQDGDGYAITYVDKEMIKMHARLTKVGEARLLDVVSTSDDPLVLPLHFMVRVWPEGNTLRWAFLDTDWMKEQVSRHVTTQANPERTLITAPGPAVRGLLFQYGADDRAHDKPDVLSRIQ